MHFVVRLVVVLSVLDCILATKLLHIRPPKSARLGSRQVLQSLALGLGPVNSTNASTQNSAIVPVALTSDQQFVLVLMLPINNA